MSVLATRMRLIFLIFNTSQTRHDTDVYHEAESEKYHANRQYASSQVHLVSFGGRYRARRRARNYHCQEWQSGGQVGICHRGGAGLRIGVAKGVFEIPANIDKHDDDVARLFLGEAWS